jgi:hypothetical protein
MDYGLGGQGSNPGRGNRFFSTPHCSDWLWAHTVSYSMNTGGSFSGDKAAGAYHSPPSSVDVKNGGAILPLPHMS